MKKPAEKTLRRTIYLDSKEVEVDRFGEDEYARLKDVLYRRRLSVSEWFRSKGREEIEKEPK